MSQKDETAHSRPRSGELSTKASRRPEKATKRSRSPRVRLFGFAAVAACAIAVVVTLLAGHLSPLGPSANTATRDASQAEAQRAPVGPSLQPAVPASPAQPIPKSAPKSQPKSAPKEAPKRKPTTRVSTTAPVGESVWHKIATCESGGRWHLNTGNGHSGGLQFTPSTWRSFGGTAYAPAAYLATPQQQIKIANGVLAKQGWRAWRICSRKTGVDRPRPASPTGKGHPSHAATPKSPPPATPAAKPAPKTQPPKTARPAPVASAKPCGPATAQPPKSHGNPSAQKDATTLHCVPAPGNKGCSCRCVKPLHAAKKCLTEPPARPVKAHKKDIPSAERGECRHRDSGKHRAHGGRQRTVHQASGIPGASGPGSGG